MFEIEKRWTTLTAKTKWDARLASFVVKAKATKAVWFPPKPAATGKTAQATAKRAGGSAKEASQRATKKTAAAKKTTRPGRKAASPVGRKRA
jgi:hypothetical protein